MQGFAQTSPPPGLCPAHGYLPLPVATRLLRVSKPLASLLLWVEVGGKGRGPHVMKTQATVQSDGIKS